MSTVLTALGIGMAFIFYIQRPNWADRTRVLAGPIYTLLQRKYYVDELYDLLFVRPLRYLGRICFGVDCYVVDGMIWLVTGIPRLIGWTLRTLQKGALQGYGLTMALGLGILLLFVWFTQP